MNKMWPLRHRGGIEAGLPGPNFQSKFDVFCLALPFMTLQVCRFQFKKPWIERSFKEDKN